MQTAYTTFLRNLYSFNNNALYIGKHKAVKSQLVPMIAKAEQELYSELRDALERGLFDLATRKAYDIQHLTQVQRDLCLRKEVAYFIADQTPYKG